MKTTSEPKVKQFIQLKDTDGMLKNLSELLQEVRDKNITSLYIGYTMDNESMRTFWFGDQKNMAEFFLTVAQMKHDFLSNRFEEYYAETYGDEE